LIWYSLGVWDWEFVFLEDAPDLPALGDTSVALTANKQGPNINMSKCWFV
jgi:chlorite dismutase